MGSGTTLIAADAIDRIACGIELEPGHVDVTVARWQLVTGKAAVDATSGLSFEEVRRAGNE
jgi:DNA modification methylase